MIHRWIIPPLLLVFAGCKPPPDFDHTVEVLKESTERGVENTHEAIETVKDPEKRHRAAEQLKRDLQNPPRQFK